MHASHGGLGYSEFYVSRKFKEISGMQLRDYLRDRKLAHACGRSAIRMEDCWASP